jgi:peptidoglycan hydrolase CwlO-like protein
MNIGKLFTIFILLILLMGLGQTNVHAQSNTTQPEHVEDNNQSMKSNNETKGNITSGLVGVANGTGNAADNITKGLGDAVNETGEAFSNSTKGAIEGIQDVINGSSQ